MDFDRAMDEYDRAHPVGTIADNFPITIGTGPSIRPATGRSSVEEMNLPSGHTDVKSEDAVNRDGGRTTTHVRVPAYLADRLARLAREMHAAYQEGRVSLPVEFCERVPAWFVILAALDEQEARRGRSRRPRRKPSA